MEALPVKEPVDRLGRLGPNSKDGSERVSPAAKVGDLPQEFKGRPFLVDGLVVVVRGARDLYPGRAELDGLPCGWGRHDLSVESNAGSRSTRLSFSLVDRTFVAHDLQILEARAV